MNLLFINIVLTIMISLILINIAKKYKNLLHHLHSNVQKIHVEFIPRLGGISLISFYTIFLFDYQNYENNLLLYFFISFLVLLLGFFEDISEVLNSKNRAILSTFIILILIFNFDYRIDSIGFELVDNLFKYEIISFIFIFLCFFASVHSYNIIDGMNGLCSGYSLVVLFSLYYVTKIQDFFLIEGLILSFIGSIIGFFLLNFPKPKIFLGDSGSFFIGLNIGIFAIIIFNLSNDISALFFALLFIYPLIEFVFSFIRRIVFLKTNPFQSDFLHLHSLMYSYLDKRKVFSDSKFNNSLSSFILINIFSVEIIISLFFLNHKYLLFFMILVSILIYFILYMILYRSVVK